MKFLHCVRRFLASDDGATDFENVVLVGCTVILCLTIQIAGHRHIQSTGAPAQPSAFVALAVADTGAGHSL